MRKENKREHRGFKTPDADGVQSEKLLAIRRLSENLSHKINNLLTPVLNYTFILKSSSQDEKALAMHEKIEDGVRKAKDILQNLVDSSRHASDMVEDADVEKELKSIVRSFESRGFRVSVKSQGPAVVRTNHRVLQIAVSNILQNAAEAGATEATIKSRVSNDDMLMEISDNGQGIKKEDLHMVFEPMFTTKADRLGLGLYMAHSIIGSLGGSISCSSRPGKKTTFLITIPLRN